MLVDSHCHLNMLKLDTFGSMEGVLAHATAQGVGHLLCVSVTMDDWAPLSAIAHTNPQVSYSVGVHPTEHGDLSVAALVSAAIDPKCVAFGETGLDFYRCDDTDRARQYHNFDIHLEAAVQAQRPVIIHTRAAREETLDYLKKAYDAGVRGVLHCFTEDPAMALRAIDYGFYISFSGIVTFKNATLVQDSARKVPLEWMLVETDAPFLAPMPHRGKTNYPGYVREVALYLAALKNVSFETLAEKTTKNFKDLFKVIV